MLLSSLDGEIFSNIVFPYIYSYRFYENNYEKVEGIKKTISKVLNERWKDRFIRSIRELCYL